MSIEYLITEHISKVKYDSTKNCYLCILTDTECNIFPTDLRETAPRLYEIFNDFRRNYERSNVFGEINEAVLETNKYNILLALSIASDTINYSNLFNVFNRISNKDCTVYIYEPHFTEYIHNFELFEYDMETDFKNSKANFVIINNTKDSNSEPTKDES